MPEIHHKGHVLVIDTEESRDGTTFYSVTDVVGGENYKVAPSQKFFDSASFIPDEVKEGVQKFHEQKNSS